MAAGGPARGHAAPGPGDLGRRVARRRAELGVSREDVAASAGMAPSYLEYLETRPAHPTSASVIRLAQALRTTPEELLGGGAEVPPGGAGPARRPVLQELDPAECLDLLSPGGVGRVAFSTASGPMVLPVNFAVDGEVIVFRTAADTPQANHADGEMALEVDKVDEVLSQGWSVLVVGRAERVTDPDDLESFSQRRQVRPWAGDSRDIYIRLLPDRITGRRISSQ